MGNANFSATVAAAVPAESVIAAALQIAIANTSEVSSFVIVAAAPKPGDVNGDGQVTVDDLLEVITAPHPPGGIQQVLGKAARSAERAARIPP